MYYNYSVPQWMFLFFLYCIIGWCFESTYVSAKSRPLHWVNRGFMRGPFLPIYGSGAIIMLIVSAPFQDNLVLTYFAGLIGATVLEYITGAVMEAMFKVRYWDYSYKRFHYKGYICLSSSIAWGFFTILMTKVIHKPIERFMYMLPTTFVHIAAMITMVYFTADFALSFKEAIDLRNMLVAMEKAKEELEHMQKRLDVVIAIANEDKEHFLNAAGELKADLKAAAGERKERVGEMVESVEDKIKFMRENVAKMPEKYLEEHGIELDDIRDKFIAAKARLSEHTRMNAFKNSILRGNPTMYSAKFAESLAELKEKIENRVDVK